MYNIRSVCDMAGMTVVSAAGRRILVVEDESIIASLIAGHLDERGFVVVGPVAKLIDALILASTAVFDAAVLDITIRGGTIYPVAEIIKNRGIPFILASGYSTWALPEVLRDQPRLTKPFRMDEFDDLLETILSSGHP